MLEAAHAFKQLAGNKLDEEPFASPAVANGRMLVRSMKALDCLGEKTY